MASLFTLFTVRTVYSLAVRSARRIWGLPGPTDFKLDSESPGPTFMPTGRRPGGGSAWQPPSQTRLPGRLSPCLAGCKARTIIMIHGSPAALRLSPVARSVSHRHGSPIPAGAESRARCRSRLRPVRHRDRPRPGGPGRAVVARRAAARERDRSDRQHGNLKDKHGGLP